MYVFLRKNCNLYLGRKHSIRSLGKQDETFIETQNKKEKRA